MATEWISPTWRMPEESNQSKFENYSLSFDGNNEQIQVDNDLFGGLEKFSISFWYNMSTVSGDRAVIGRWSLADPQILIYHQGTTGYWRIIFVNNSGVSQGITTTFAATLDTWQFISFIYDGSTVSVQLNNETVQSLSSSGSIRVQSAAPSFQIGADNSARDFAGQLDQVCIFNYALSTDQRNYLYNSGTPINPMAISGNAPIAYYSLGGGSTGDAGTSPSTLTVPNESVPSATVFDFDGSNKITGTSDLISGNESRSFSLWYKTTSTAAQIPFSLGSPTDQTNGAQFAYCINRSSTTTAAIFGKNSAYDTSVFTVPNTSDGNWHHLLVTYDQSSLKVYIDGNLEATPALPSTSYITSAGFTIGGWTIVGNRLFNGEISNVQVWNAELETSDVTALYNNGVPLLTGTQPQAANLKAWYKLNVDTSTWDGSDWIIGEAQANYSSALSTNIGAATETDYIDLTSVFTTGGGSDNSISFWLKTTQGGGDNTILGAAGSRYITVHFGYVYSSSSSSDGFRMYSSSAINDGAWHHIVYTYNQTSGAWKIYVDGDISNSVTAATGQPVFPISRFGGKPGFVNYYYDGSISNVAYYDVELDSAKVSTLYNNGTPEQSISYSPVSWWKLNNLTTGIQDSVGSNNGTNTGVTVTDIQVSTLNGASSGMTTANLVNSDLTRSIPYSSYSMEFDSASQNYITLPSSTIFTDFSLSFWYKQDGAAGSFETVVGRDTIDGGILTSIVFNGGKLQFKNRPGSWTDLTTTTASNTEFKHYSVTYDSTANELKGYCNGILEVTTTPVFSSATGSEQSFNRIARYGTTYYLDGQLSNLATFSSILSEDQVLTIYNGGVPNDISSLSPVNWWSLSGDSYYNGTDWICPDLGSGGNNGTSVNMAGAELVGNGPGSTANGTATSMNIPANLKGNAPNSSKNAFSVNMTAADRVADVPA